MTDFAGLWREATPWADYLRPDMEQYRLWQGVASRVELPSWADAAFAETPLRRLLVLAADWCGDAANTVPVLAALAARRGLELRVLERDSVPQLMDRYLTNGSRSIPIAIGLDDGFRELGHWGPRPLALQTWMLANQATIPSPQRYAFARQWYARDKGETTLRELHAAISG